MKEHFGDARLEELKLLSEIDRCGEFEVTPDVGPVRDLVAFLVQERLVNDPNLRPGEFALAGSGSRSGSFGTYGIGNRMYRLQSWRFGKDYHSLSHIWI